MPRHLKKAPVDMPPIVLKSAFKLSKNHTFVTERGQEDEIIKIIRPPKGCRGPFILITRRYPDGLHQHRLSQVRVLAETDE